METVLKDDPKFNPYEFRCRCGRLKALFIDKDGSRHMRCPFFYLKHEGPVK